MRYQTATGVVLFFLVYFLGFYRPNDHYISASSTMINQKAPAFVLPAVSGGQVDFESYRGRPVLLVFWTVSNAECRRELGVVSQIAPELRSKAIGVVSIHLGEAGNLQDYLRANHIALTSLMDVEEAAAEEYRVTGAHKLVLVGADGKIKKASQETVDEQTLRKWIDEV
jgi:peroxiredoxin